MIQPSIQDYYVSKTNSTKKGLTDKKQQMEYLSLKTHQPKNTLSQEDNVNINTPPRNDGPAQSGTSSTRVEQMQYLLLKTRQPKETSSQEDNDATLVRNDRPLHLGA